MPGLPRWWLEDGLPARLLAPVAAVFAALVRLRRESYRRGWRRSAKMPVPVLVVGNVFVGGTGKTPLVLWLARQLRKQGRRPGIVTRGYGGRSPHWPRRVAAGSDPLEVGDEAVLLARRSGCPVAAGPDRAAAARSLLEECDVLISDDGLQHYALARDREIVVFDGRRGAGNGRCFPAGPLREPLSRAAAADLVIASNEGGDWRYRYRLQPSAWVNLRSGERLPPQAFAGTAARAIAGIGNPERFFDCIRALGVQARVQAFPDHHRYRPEELEAGEEPLLMTEKDAVKCAGFAQPQWWFLAVDAVPEPAAEAALFAVLEELLHVSR